MSSSSSDGTAYIVVNVKPHIDLVCKDGAFQIWSRDGAAPDNFQWLATRIQSNPSVAPSYFGSQYWPTPLTAKHEVGVQGIQKFTFADLGITNHTDVSSRYTSSQP